MSELIQIANNRGLFQKHLLVTASSLALAACMASCDLALADDTEHPTVWIELGGQMERPQGVTSPVIAPFMTRNTDTEVYQGASFIESQRQGRFAFGAEGKITFQPTDSDWKFSAGVRYGRSHASRHLHKQTAGLPPIPFYYSYAGNRYDSFQTFSSVAVADSKTENSERHVIVDFSVGKDVGLGLFGRGGTSTVSAGVRFASFTASSSAYITGRPFINTHFENVYLFSGLVKLHEPFPTFHQYTMFASATRSFGGIGPSLSWDASTPVLGNAENAELTLDWGINGALLFGRQKAKTSHTTQAYRQYRSKYSTSYQQTYHHHPAPRDRSRSVVVPNIGGFAGFSVRYPNAKVSFGYRADYFFGAMDTGIDVRSTKDVGFRGPYATLSIGLGG